MRISVNILKRSYQNSFYIYCRKTKKVNFNRDPPSSDKMKTLKYLLNRGFKVTYLPIFVPVFDDYEPINCPCCDKINSNIRMTASIKKINSGLLLSDEKKFHWEKMETKFENCNIEELDESIIKMLFGCSKEKWIDFQLVLEELKKDFYDISLEVNIIVVEKGRVSSKNKTKEEDLILRFESHLRVENKKVENSEMRAIEYNDIFEFINNIEDKYKHLLEFKTVHKKKNKGKFNKL